MGKNQAYKAMQKARSGSGSGGPDEVEDGMIDGTFHSPEWHAARLASLKTSHTITWEEYKKKQKEDEVRKGELEADKDKMMREYRAQLDAERESKLANGRNHSTGKSNHKKDRKSKDSRKKSDKKRKRSRRKSSETSSSSESSSSEDERESKQSRSRSRSRSRKGKRDRKHKSRNKYSSSSSDSSVSDREESGGGGPLPLSRFFGAANNSSSS